MAAPAPGVVRVRRAWPELPMASRFTSARTVCAHELGTRFGAAKTSRAATGSSRGTDEVMNPCAPSQLNSWRERAGAGQRPKECASRGCGRQGSEAEGAGRGMQRDLGSVEKQDYCAFQIHPAPREGPGGLEHDSDVRQIVGRAWRADGRVEMRIDEQRVLISKESRCARASHALHMSASAVGGAPTTFAALAGLQRIENRC